MVQGFNVGKSVVELEARHSNLVRGQAIEHEGVVRIWAVGDVDLLNCSVRGGHSVILGRVRGIEDAARRWPVDGVERLMIAGLRTPPSLHGAEDSSCSGDLDSLARDEGFNGEAPCSSAADMQKVCEPASTEGEGNDARS